MQYAFEHWNAAKRQQPPEKEFDFSRELAELEAGLTIRQWPEKDDQRTAQTDTAPPAQPAFTVPLDEESRALLPVDEVASNITEQVVQKIREWQAEDTQSRLDLEADLSEWRRQAQEFYEDNRILARQIEQLMQEREQLLQTIQGQEVELKRFVSVGPRLYFKV